MTNEPYVQLEYSDEFKRNLKQLYKKFRSVRRDLEPLLTQLSQGDIPGDHIPGIGYTVYKVRLKNSDLHKGKSGGYRVIYYLKTSTFVFLVTIYAKTEQTDVGTDEIRRIIETYKPLSE